MVESAKLNLASQQPGSAQSDVSYRRSLQTPLAVLVAVIGVAMMEIQLTKGKVALVDDADYARLSEFNSWYAHKNKDRYYARTRKMENGVVTYIHMHRVLMDARDGEDVDHIDGNGLNNQRKNLRRCTRSQNNMNQKRRSDSTTGYKGVFRSKSSGRFHAAIWKDKKKKHIGCFGSAIEAAKAYDKEAINTYDEFARINFPEGTA